MLSLHIYDRMKEDPVFGVIGGGSWATALVKLLSENGRRLNWYMRDTDAIEHIEKYHHHSKYLTSVELDADSFTLTNNIDYVVEESDILIFAIPSAYFLKEVSKVTASYDGKILISAVKGFVGERYLTVAEYFHHDHKVPFDRIGVISGPCHAEEVLYNRLVQAPEGGRVSVRLFQEPLCQYDSRYGYLWR